LVKTDKPFGKISEPLGNQQVTEELNEKMISFSSDAATEMPTPVLACTNVKVNYI